MAGRRLPEPTTPTVTYRVVCVAFGTDRSHEGHEFVATTRERAGTIKADREAMVGGNVCKQWVVQGRVVNPWGDPDTAEAMLRATSTTWYDDEPERYEQGGML